MALVSPGIQISINEQSQYVSNAVGSVPLVLLATAENKTYNGAIAAGTTKANAGKLQSFTSQRDLVTALGTPTFRLSSAGSPIHAGELNEYGLMAAYSALGLGNQLFAIRADVDLDQLVGTAVRPSANPANGTHWLDIVNTEWGIYSLNRATNEFEHIVPTVVTNGDQVEQDGDFAYTVAKPKTSIGTMGSYALVTINPDGLNAGAFRLYRKTGVDSVAAPYGPGANAWVQVGSPAWQLSTPAVIGTVTNPAIVASREFFINSQTITTTGTTLASLVTDINTNPGLTGVKAAAVDGKLALFCTDAATAGAIVISSGVGPTGLNVSSILGITAGTYHAPILFYGNYAQSPTGGWTGVDTQPRPTRSIWWKIGATGQGLNTVVKRYNASTQKFDALNVPAFVNFQSAVYGLDPVGGGVNIQTGQLIVTYSSTDTTYNNLRFAIQLEHTPEEINGEAIATGGAITGSVLGTFQVNETVPGQEFANPAFTVTVTTDSAEGFVTAILAANIPFVTARVNDNGTISIIHQTGGQIVINPLTTGIMDNAGFATNISGDPISGTGFIQNKVAGRYLVGKFSNITNNANLFQIKESAPFSAPESGTLWYYSNPADVDIMVNTGGSTGWRGYRVAGTDTRGYNLNNTDPAGVIVSATQPTSQSNAGTLVPGDLWLDSSDLDNYPKLYRCTNVSAGVATWTEIDKTDQITSNGIIFADARWDTDGTSDPITDDLPAITDLLTSNYIDQDAPDYRLYPKGTLLFNTRRSGYNVKRFVTNYFNDVSFPDPGAIPGTSGTLPNVKNTWVTASGLNNDGSMKAGTKAQRAIVVAALSAAIDSNVEIREDLYQFNLLCAPGYPELIDNMVALNTDRGETAFVIGDTPMTLPATSTAIAAWNNNTNGDGLATASPYLGVYYPAGVTNDLSGNTVAVPASHAVLRTFLYSDNVSYPWFAPAGTHRGLVNNIQDVGYVDANTGAWIHNSISQGLRDALYIMNINPVTQLPGVGIVVWGQETKSGTSTARNRVNVVRLENFLRTSFKTIANGFLFEPNDQITRKSIASQIESALNDIMSKRGLYDFLVICDTTNNTSSTIANNQLFVDVAIEPARDVEFIYIPIALYNPGAIASLGTAST